jgi:cytochrome c oxidase cbb3-type subunit III
MYRTLCVAGAIACFSCVLAAQATPQGPGVPKKLDLETVDSGQKIFQANCAFCHGATAKGGESGPDLLRSVLVLDDENGNKIGVVVHEGRLDKGMPKFPLTDAQIADISAFLHDRIKAAAQRGSYKILNIVTGDPKKGEAYFNGAGGCAGCHSVTGDLAHIGTKYDAVTIQQHVVMPREFRRGRGPAPPSPSPKQVVTATVTLPSGESFKGHVAAIDDFTIAIVDDAGEYHAFTRQGTVPKVEIHDPLQAHTEMLMKYSDADIHNLTAYLFNLK